MSFASVAGERGVGGAEDRVLAAWEIVSVVVSTLVCEWLIYSLGGGSQLLLAFPVALVFALMFISHRARGESARVLGFRFDNFTRAARLLLVPTLLAVAFCLTAGFYYRSIDFDSWFDGQSILGLPAFGLAWTLVQQYVLQGFLHRRAQIVWGRGKVSLLVVALLFSVFHLPNPLLTLATFAGGLVWAYVYRSAPNLFALCLSHSIMKWVLISTLPAHWLNNLRVGYKFFG